MKTTRLLCAVLAGLAPLTPLPHASAVSADGVHAVSFVDRAAGTHSAAYWTERRMETATPVDPRLVRQAGPPDAIPSAGYTGGSRVVGALFLSNGTGRHYCTASVVGSAKRNLLITAAHCLYSPSGRTWNRNIVFVPKYSRGHRPYGTWPVWLMVADQRWIDHGDPDADVAFAAVQEMDGRRIADVVGANELLINTGYFNRVTVIGYPSRSNNPSDRPIRCAGQTYRQADGQLRFDCAGFTGGTSGSPWIAEYDDQAQRGYVVGVIGGYQRGGDTDWRSYSPLFDDDIGHLAVNANDQA
ncbi:trypsin-like serine peptidase [Actinoallomurus rhizosphaericola]|uniref:trypsin-like serine peptidase n=1 Tax=Actinoallomurus rhizosphaericola TaxID=2952536 RepID=UPI0020905F38|nr:trypsin-like peptidase domain-containing protein [Actinoallomurus rhizosphaericola]MCO5994550.1 trypsin-like peptidase domain-containing protein [Actinoallomurus rhizosphaericola]